MDVESLPHYCRIFPPAWPKSFYYIVLCFNYMKIFPFLCVLNQTNKSMHSTFKVTIPSEDKGPAESVQEGWLLHRLSSKTIQQHT